MISETYQRHFQDLDLTDVESYLQVSYRLGASDVHFEPQGAGLRVRARIAGRLRELAVVPIPENARKAPPLIMQLKAKSGLNLQSRVPEDGRVEVDCDGQLVNIRISTLPVLRGEKIVCRIFDVSKIQSLEGLDFRKNNLQRLLESLQRRSGLFLISGPSGSGKTTTIYALLKALEQADSHLVTIEDPVEYLFEGLSQVQVSSSGIDFAQALRAVLRQDPDIIMIGEIRDRETAEIAAEASLTGHLVLSTVHAKDSLSAIMRLLELDVSPVVIAQALNGVISQRLLPRLCKHCTESIAVESLDGLLCHQASGCEYCLNQGHFGRCGVQEVLVISEHLRRLIALGLPEDELRMVALKSGLETLKEDAIMKSVAGHIGIRDALGSSDEELSRIVRNIQFYS